SGPRQCSISFEMFKVSPVLILHWRRRGLYEVVKVAVQSLGFVLFLWVEIQPATRIVLEVVQLRCQNLAGEVGTAFIFPARVVGYFLKFSSPRRARINEEPATIGNRWTVRWPRHAVGGGVGGQSRRANNAVHHSAFAAAQHGP